MGPFSYPDFIKLNLISGITTYEYVRAHRLALEPQAQNQLSDPTPEEQNKKDSQYQTTDRYVKLLATNYTTKWRLAKEKPNLCISNSS